ncbi:MAG: mitochondrial fission ELM1 family protein [Albidovulum sp.]
MAGARCWIVSDGKAGDEAQCLGIAESLDLEGEIRRVSPRPPFVWFMPWGGIDVREGPRRQGSPLAGQLPDIAIASGRRTVPYLRKIKALSGGRTFTVYLKDPRIGTRVADFIWVPEHDTLRGPNVMATLTSPHRISPERLAEAAANPPHNLARTPRPRIAILIGGDSQHYRFTEDDRSALAHALRDLAAGGSFLMATASRRTPPTLLSESRAIVQAAEGFFWSGTGQNPLVAMLALADAIIVTADSVNMVGEAVATGKPVLVFTPSGGNAKINSFLNGLAATGAIRPFTGSVPAYTYAPIDATPQIAIEIARRYTAHRKTLRNAS